MGSAQVQASTGPPAPCAYLACRSCLTPANAVPALEASLWQWSDVGSRMSREAHVRFWERAVVKSRRATHFPLHRQSQIFAHAGLTLSRTTLMQWVAATSELLGPLVAA